MPRMNLDEIPIDGKSYNNTELAHKLNVSAMAVGKAISNALFSLYKKVRLKYPEFTKEETLKAIISFLIEEGNTSESDIVNCFSNKRLIKMIQDFEEKFKNE